MLTTKFKPKYAALFNSSSTTSGYISRYAASGLSIRGFCRREKLSEASFYGWRRTISERDAGGRPSKQPAFLPLVVEGNHGQAIVIELAGGLVLRLPEAISATRLAEFVYALEARGER